MSEDNITSKGIAINQYGILDISDPLGTQKIILQHNTEPSDELFSLLEYYSEVTTVGDKWLKKKYKNNLKRKYVYNTFKSFIHQAKLYYISAEQQDFRIAPISYFYSFENLVKAYLTVVNGNTYRRKDSHGLNYLPQKDKSVYAMEKGVFADFYKKLTDTSMPKSTCLNVRKLLSYCSDISYEYTNYYQVYPPYVKGKSAHIVPQVDNKAHILLALTPALNVTHNKIKKAINKHYDIAELNNKQKMEILNIPLNEIRNYSYYISKKGWDPHNDSLIDIGTSVQNLFPAKLYPSLQTHEQQFMIFLPHKSKSLIDFNEVLAIYVIMYYLSNLVRYFPNKLEVSTDDADRWLLKRFVESSPITMLKYMVYLILDKQVILERF